MRKDEVGILSGIFKQTPHIRFKIRFGETSYYVDIIDFNVFPLDCYMGLLSQGNHMVLYDGLCCFLY